MSWSTARKNRARDNARRLGSVQRTVEREFWAAKRIFTKILDTRYGGWILVGCFFLALGFFSGAMDKL